MTTPRAWNPATLDFRREFPIAIALGIGLVLIALAYRPGLDGQFMLDDFAILSALGEFGGVRDFPTLLLYLTAGGGDPTGRPVAQLTFLLDGNAWPTDPRSFKRTNVMLHLLNGALLAWCLLRLAKRSGVDARRAVPAAVLAALLWCAHPLWVSTTLYVVQRQAMLAASFFLVTLLAWEFGWVALEQGRLRLAWLLGGFTVLTSTMLAALSKTNGMLTPLLLALIAWTIYRPTSRRLPDTVRIAARRIAITSIVVPSLFTLALLGLAILHSVESMSLGSPWTLEQRVLSQPRALMTYLGLLFVPREGGRGIFGDEFPLSYNLLDPASTLYSILSLGTIAALVWRCRNQRMLVVAAGTFAIGHLLESGPLNLELYFEHRNYLPGLFLFFPVALALTTPGRASKPVQIAAAVLLSLVLLALLALRSTLWASTDRMVAAAALRYPDSERVQLYLSSREIDTGAYLKASQRLQVAMQRRSDRPLLAFNLLQAQCLAGRTAQPAMDFATRALKTAPRWKRRYYDWISARIASASFSRCDQFAPRNLALLVDALAANPVVASSSTASQDVLALRGELALIEGDTGAAKRWMQASLDLAPNLDACLWLGSRHDELGYSELGMRFRDENPICAAQSGEVRFDIGGLRELVYTAYPAYRSTAPGTAPDSAQRAD